MAHTRKRPHTGLLLGGIAIVACILTAQSCSLQGTRPHEESRTNPLLTPLAYEEVEGLLSTAQNRGGLLVALQRACSVPGGADAEAAAGCEILTNNKPTPQNELSFLKAHYCPYDIKGENPARFTGYYTGVLAADLLPSPRYPYPIYARPTDLTKDAPYDTRASIELSGLNDRAEILAYAADPVDLFFMHVQGSGTLVFPDGSTRALAFAGKNQRPYTAIGRKLIERGVMTRETLNGSSLRAWLKAHPREAEKIMHANESYVFFRWTDDALPRGASGAELTPEHSLAVDHSALPFGAPILIETTREKNGGLPERFVRLAVAQDTGSAIKGAKRFDIYFGPGDRAREYADRQNSPGRVVVFLPANGKTCRTRKDVGRKKWSFF